MPRGKVLFMRLIQLEVMKDYNAALEVLLRLLLCLSSITRYVPRSFAIPFFSLCFKGADGVAGGF